MPTVSYGVAATADDATWVPGLSFFTAGFTAAGTASGGLEWLGLRFPGVAVPQGATVTSATLTLTRQSVTGSGFGVIKGVASDNAPVWSSTVNPQVASKTSQSVTIVDGATQNYDVAAIVQAIVSRSGWGSGNALAFAGDPTGAAGEMLWVDYDNSTTNCAQLSITYDTGAGGGANPAAATHAHVATSPSLNASTNLTFQGAATGTTTVTLPAHQAGDLIVAFAFRDGSNTQPTIPAAGWTTLQNATGANTCSHVLVSKVATSSAETVGTFTNATSVVVQVYRPKAGYALSVGANGTQTGTATSITYPAITLQDTGGTSWVAAFGGHRSVNTTLENPPSGMVQRATVVDATDEAAGFDTNSGVASWTAQSVALGGTASGWRSSVVEIKAATAPNPNAGPDNAAQIQAATSPAFTTKSVINPDAAAQAHLSGSPNLSAGALSVAPTSSSQSQTATSAALASASMAAPSFAAQTHTATSPGLVGRSALSPAGADQSQVATDLTPAARASTLPDGGTHGQTTTEPALLFAATIQPAGAGHDHNSSVPSLASRAVVVSQSATQAQEASSAALTPSGSIGLQSASQGQAATPAAAVSRAAVAVDPATSGQSASAPNLYAAASVAVEAGVSGQLAAPAPITSRSVVSPNDAGQVNESSLPTIVWRGDLPPVPPIRHVVLIGRRRTASLTARVRVASLTGRTRKIIR